MNNWNADLMFFFFFNDTATTEIYTLSLHDALPIWDGAWTRALPTVSDGMTAFQFTFASNRSAIAIATAGGQGITDLHVLYGSPAELEAEGDVSPRFCTSAATKTLLGTVAGLDTNEIAFIRVPGSAAQAFILPGDPGDFTLP